MDYIIRTTDQSYKITKTSNMITAIAEFKDVYPSKGIIDIEPFKQ